jgi:hypothetical protein
MKKFSVMLCAVAMLCACSVKESNPLIDGVEPESADFYGEGGGGDNGEGGEEQQYAGKVTAGEWRDLDHWTFWSDLMTKQDQEGNGYSAMSSYWELYTNNRVAVRVKDANGAIQKDVPVRLICKECGPSVVLYEARTDNKGETNLFVGLTQLQEEVEDSTLMLIVDGMPQEIAVQVTRLGDEVVWNECTASVPATTNIDIAFIVDATGSMSDEIDFLKADLTNIITTVQNNHAEANIRTAALFYRDEGDEYVTKANNFTSDLSQTVAFIQKQNADGGGDFPEAVHTALEAGLQELSWREESSIRLAFMLLDAPPHKRNDVIESLQFSIPRYASHGIRIIPVAASGIDKQTEFFLRFTAISTDGTYVFLTNHSGVGGDHIEATVGEYEVELLNELIVRLINQYAQ